MQNILTKYKKRYFSEAEIWIDYTNKKKWLTFQRSEKSKLKP